MILNNRPAAIITVFKDVKKICSQQIKKKNRNSKQRNRNYKKRQKCKL